MTAVLDVLNLERTAAIRPAEREILLRDAASIREGKMTSTFQYMVTRQAEAAVRAQ